ncbi:MAG: holo-[acyl-carrier-protein] synthase [Alphaproteobacteria bacterium]|nr:holo-[acyl-carrier-protein] synthase [Alphaproteobacteria bacterium]
MIVGLGTDIVNVGRVERTCSRYARRFMERLFTKQEQKDILALAETVRPYKMAKLFAAKEAAAKALGTGFSKGIAWSDIEVSHDESGKPLLVLYNKALIQANKIAQGKDFTLWLSLSDDYPMAQAVVVIEKIG